MRWQQGRGGSALLAVPDPQEVASTGGSGEVDLFFKTRGGTAVAQQKLDSLYF